MLIMFTYFVYSCDVEITGVCSVSSVWLINKLFELLLQQMVEENVEEQDLGNVQETEYVQEPISVPEDLCPPEDVQDDVKYSNFVEEKKWPGWPGENVFRILVPAHKVGSIIGRKGEHIKKICEETKARIKILDGPPGTTERTVS